MRLFVDILESLTDGLRVVVGLLVLLIMGSVMIMTFGASYVASSATEELAAKAEVIGKEAIKAQREAERDRALAKDGWGYSSGNDGFGEESGPKKTRSSRKREDNDWGAQD